MLLVPIESHGKQTINYAQKWGMGTNGTTDQLFLDSAGVFRNFGQNISWHPLEGSCPLRSILDSL